MAILTINNVDNKKMILSICKGNPAFLNLDLTSDINYHCFFISICICVFFYLIFVFIFKVIVVIF